MSAEVALDNEVYGRVLKKVIGDQGLHDATLEVSTGSAKGDNYLGCIYRVRARGTKSGQPTDLHLILKTSTAAILRDTIPTQEAYQRESYVYNTVLKELQRVQEDRDVDPRCKFSFVRCYHASDAYLEEMLVLEDLKVQGFAMFDRLKSTDYSHAALVMSALGKLHALSYALKTTRPKMFEDITDRCPDILCHGPFGKALESYFNAAAEKFLQVTKKFKVKAKVEEFASDICGRMQAATRPSRYAVLGHGDCWVNNMLFKYKNGVPVDIRLLDYQLMRYGSPVLDMFYFIFCCTDQTFRKDHYYTMLDLYHKSLAASLKAHSLDIDDVFPKEAFRAEIKRFADFGLGMAILTLRTFASDPDDATDFESMIEKSGKVNFTMPSGAGYERFVERVNGVAEDYVEYGYLE